MKVAVVKETFPGEDRVGLVPANIKRLAKAGFEILVETGAGVAAGFDDAQYRDQGAQIVESRSGLAAADVVVR